MVLIKDTYWRGWDSKLWRSNSAPRSLKCYLLVVHIKLSLWRFNISVWKYTRVNILVRAERGLKAGRERKWIKSVEKSFDRDKWAVDLSLRLRIKREVLKSGGPLIEWRSVSRAECGRRPDRDGVTAEGLIPSNVCLKYCTSVGIDWPRWLPL